MRTSGTLCGPDRPGFYGAIRDVPRTGWAASLRAAGPSGRRADRADTHGWASGPRAAGPGAQCSRSEPTAACPGIGLGSLEPAQRWTDQHWLRHCTGWGRRAGPGGSRLKAETTAGRARTGRGQDAPCRESAVSGGHDPNLSVASHRSTTPGRDSYLRSGEIWQRAFLQCHPGCMNTSDTPMSLESRAESMAVHIQTCSPW